MPLRLPRFRLRTALIAMAIVAIVLATYGNAVRVHERERALGAELRKFGIHAIDPHSAPSHLLPPRIEEVLVDDNLGFRTDGISWTEKSRATDQKVTAEQMSRLAGFAKLRRLVVHGDVVEPPAVVAIAQLPTLEELTLLHVPLDDAQLLEFAKLPRLRELTLEATGATDDAIEQLRDRLPELNVFDD
ncbi:MAG: hypothetical protein JNK76_02700 [Planctomycetales bacterium]|nr:hypothetical protein [Planctomycetales bacterium]MBN8626207.1 hypothetical protein [Planctomycetota bacterium]